MMLRWALKHCPKVTFLIKCDDDTFVNVENLINVMKSKRTDTIHGHLYANDPPHRDPSSKWYVSKEEYNGAEYPPFVAGTFYVLGGSILRRLYDASEQEPFFWLEDVFLTGFVAEKAGVNRTHENLIADDQFSSAGSVIYPVAVSSSLINPEAPSYVAVEGDLEAASPAEPVLVVFCLDFIFSYD
ncbi:hypothetical protein HPB47_010983 [Ixodes persulcatus]|uniref:Uncharacterized protein n=1 Tax=Ixodes persulcatus TaxID=34615 RepID=A0AC60NXJ4_IXOPE|nr:hypothetical protein HPB47_010983 [Ixodes persulcatus]